MKPIEITEATFQQEVQQSAVPVLVDFWAVWCGPCRLVAPIVEEIAGQYAGALKVGKVNVDENNGLANMFGIRSIPTLLLFDKGSVVEQIIGALPKKDIVAKLAPHLKAGV